MYFIYLSYLSYIYTYFIMKNKLILNMAEDIDLYILSTLFIYIKSEQYSHIPELIHIRRINYVIKEEYHFVV